MNTRETYAGKRGAERTRLLAALAVLALVVCAFAAIAPSDVSGEGDTLTVPGEGEGVLYIDEEYLAEPSWDFSTADFSAYSDIVIATDVEIESTAVTTFNQGGKIIWIAEGATLSFDGNDGQSTSYKMDGIVNVVRGASLIIGSTAFEVTQGFSLTAEAGAIVKVETNDGDINWDVIGSYNEASEQDVMFSLKSGTITISNIQMSNPGTAPTSMEVAVDGEAELIANEITGTVGGQQFNFDILDNSIELVGDSTLTMGNDVTIGSGQSVTVTGGTVNVETGAEVIIPKGSGDFSIVCGGTPIVSFTGTVTEDMTFDVSSNTAVGMSSGSWVNFSQATTRSAGTMTVSNITFTGIVDAGDLVVGESLEVDSSITDIGEGLTIWGSVSTMADTTSAYTIDGELVIAYTGSMTINEGDTASGSGTVNAIGSFEDSTGTITPVTGEGLPAIDAGDADLFSYAIRAGFPEVNVTAPITLDGTTVDDEPDPYLRSNGEYTIMETTVVTIQSTNSITVADGYALVNNGIIYFDGSGEIILNAGSEMENSGRVVNTDVGSGTIKEGDDVTDDTPTRQLPLLENVNDGIISVTVDVQRFVTPVKDVYVEGETVDEWNKNFNASQRVIVREGTTWTISAGNVVTIDGELVVYGTIVISDSQTSVIDAGSLTIGSEGSNTAKATVSGSIENHGTLTFVAGATVVTGSITSDGALEVAGGTLTNEGTVTVSAEGTLEVAGGTFSNSGEVLIHGAIDVDAGAAISNSGTVTVANGAVEGTSGGLTVTQTAAGAVVDVQSVMLSGASTLTITDNGIFTGASANSIVVAGDADQDSVVSGLYVVQTLSGSSSARTHTMQVSGGINVTAYDADGDVMTDGDPVTITVTVGGYLADSRHTAGVTVPYESTLNLCDDAQLVIAASEGVFTVDGTVLQTGTGAQAIGNSGRILVNGLIQSIEQIDSEDGVTAARYITQAQGAAMLYNYSSFITAVDSVAAETNVYSSKVITVLGDLVVAESVNVPAPIQVAVDTQYGSTFTIGDDYDDVVTFEAGTRLSNAGTIVVGTLTFVDKSDDRTNGTVVSDVMTESEERNGFRTYTNIYTALGNAQPGDVIIVTKDPDAGYVEITQNVTVPEDVTLQVPDDAAALWLADGVTLTVNGTLETEPDVYAETMFALTARNVTGGERSSAIVVNGALRTALEYDYAIGVAATSDEGAKLSDGAPIAGAYYRTDDYYVISSLQIAVGSAADIYEDVITVNGAVASGDVVFTAAEDCDTIVVGQSITGIATSLTVSSLTLADGAKLDANAAFTGDVIVGDAMVTASRVTALDITSSGSRLVITGTVTIPDEASLTIAAGTVYSGYGSTSAGIFADGLITVASGATLEVGNGLDFEVMLIEGALNVPSGQTATGDTMVVAGTVTVAAQTDSTQAGALQVFALAIGFSEVYEGEAPEAAFSGPVDAMLVIVLEGTTVDAVAQADLDEMEATAYNVEGSIWMTVYDYVGIDIGSVDYAPVENAYFTGRWFDEDGNDVSERLIGTYDVVYAEIDYDVYEIVLHADINAVSSVTIDGNIMTYGLIGDGSNYNYAFTAMVAAGTHTISYELTNGYSGTGVLTVNGTEMSGMTFETTGTPTLAGEGKITYNLQLTGFQKSGYVDPDSGSGDIVINTGDDGLGITDYLLIILVVLIVVMAVIVALRLMRS